MKSHGLSAILLAAGYGTRMYPLTKDCPKTLLRLGEGVVLDALVEQLAAIPGLSRVVLVTNHRFLGQFQAWQSNRPASLELLDDGSDSPQTRLGAIRDLLLGRSRVGLEDDVLVLGTDNLFTWALSDFVAFAKTKRPSSSVALRRAPSLQEASRCAVVELDPQARLIRCIEKPAHPSSLTVALCVYYFPAPCRGRIEEFVRVGGNVDAPGYFIEWLIKQEAVYGFMTAGEWFDIGSQDTYQQAVRVWCERSSSKFAHE